VTSAIRIAVAGSMAEAIHQLTLSAIRAAAALGLLLALGAVSRADLQLCNRMSYVVESSIGIETKGTTETRGWFRIDPGQCRSVIQGEVKIDGLFLYARALAIYGASPLPQTGHAELCVAQDTKETFVISSARICARTGQRLVRFTAVNPTANDQMLTANLAEEAEYTNEQARDAGIQRLLVMAGYDATPIDGIRGAKTDAALLQFIQDNKLTATAAGRSDFFDVLIAAAQRPEGAGFAWCNETPYTVMAAIGTEEKGSVTTRGWYRVAPGSCVRPDVSGQARKLFSFAEAVDANGQSLKPPARPLSWGGDTVLCTRLGKFELFDQKDCALKGLSSAGFATIELAAGRTGTTVRFK
jgi:uncharacterized membrane protein